MAETQPTPSTEGEQQQVAARTAREAAERTRTRPLYAPRTDIYETDDGLVIMVDMPGVPAEAADATLEKRMLTIRGRTQDQAPEGFSPVYREYTPGDYERVFTLSEDIDAERIEAQVKGGILRLFLPRAAAAQTKRIQIRAD